MDPYSLLQEFLNDSNDPIANADDTQNGTLDNSLDIETEVKLPKTRKKTNKSTEKCDDAELKLDSGKKNNKFVPGKGQKTAFNKLQKIKGLVKLAENVTDEPFTKRTTKKRLTAKSRQKRGPQRQYNDSSSEEGELVSNARARPVMPAFVNLDSDDEYAEKPISINRNFASGTSLQTSENDEIKVVVKFGQKVDDYMLRPFQKLSELIEKVATCKKVKAETIFLMLNGKIVPASSSLRDIDYIPGLTISAHVAENNAATSHNDEKTKRSKRNDQIELKIQTALRKQPFVVHIGKSDQISSLFFQCAEEFKCKPNKIRLEFDGEPLDSKKTAAENDLEGGEVIDMFISSK